jgi:hypothetical protein
MSTSDPQFLYIILVLPSLFGLTLIGDGVNKLVYEESGGVLSLVFGILFIGSVVFAYLFFSTIVSG